MSRRAGVDASERLAEHVWRVPLPCRTLPPFDHVNTYLIVSDGVAAVVDPGSSDPGSLDLLGERLDALQVRLVKAVLLTHTHPDHVAGLAGVLAAYDRPSLYVHAAEAGRLQDVPAPILLDDDRVLTVGGALVRALHTPGHSPGHLSFLVDAGRDGGNDGGGTALVGDLIAGKGSSWVGYPEGDVAAYLASLTRLRSLRPERLGPGHGAPVADADAKLARAAEHRLERERAVLAALADGVDRLEALRGHIYPELPEASHELAERSLLAHLLKLMHEMKVVHLGEDPSGPYALRR